MKAVLGIFLLWMVQLNCAALEPWKDLLGSDAKPQVLVFSSNPHPPDRYYFISERQQGNGIAYQYVGTKILSSFLRTLKEEGKNGDEFAVTGWVHFRLKDGKWVSLQLYQREVDGKVILLSKSAAWLLPDSFVSRIKKESSGLLTVVPPVVEKSSNPAGEIRKGFFEVEGKEIRSKGDFDQAFASWPEERRDLSDGKEFPAEDLDIEKETFRIYVPENYRGDEAYGMLIFISAGDALPQFSSEWNAVFEEKKIIWATAKGIGNKTPAGRRFRLPREARNYIGKHYNIDPQRIYLSGFSGGGRMSSGMIANFPGSFTGTIHFCGVSALARAIPHYSKPNTEIYGWPPVSGALSSAKRFNHFVLITGSKDPNYDDTKNVFGWMEKNRIAAHLIDVPDLAHQVPRSPQPISEALDFLDQPRKQLESEGSTAKEQIAWKRELDQLDKLSLKQIVKARELSVKMWDRYEKIKNDEKFMQLIEKLEQWPSK